MSNSQQVNVDDPQSAGSEKAEGNPNNLDEKCDSKPTNEYVLNVAFISFLGFTLLQFVFALAARSEAMLADCAAMSVDAVTYLFNYCAERLKHREDTEEEKMLPPDVLHRRRKLQKLHLELFPPLLSVATLAVVTAMALKQAIEIILDDDRDIENPPDVMIMLVFSALNLLLDMLNVACFARVEDNVVGLDMFHHHEQPATVTEMTGLLDNNANGNDATESYSVTDAELSTLGNEDDISTASHELNLNMCSAWTHICADTLRSVAVLLAAGFSTLYPDLLTPSDADSYSAIVVSLIIIISLGPLLQGICATALEIRDMVHEGREKSSPNLFAISRR